MIVKQRKVSIYIEKLQALLRRISPTHPKRKEIEETLSRSIAGHNGEKSIDYYINFLPEQKYFIFHDLRLEQQQHYFQLDILLVSSSFFLIVEVKNISGTIVFEPEFHQFLRISHSKEERFPNPILQVGRQRTQFITWLAKHKLYDIPVETLVVFSNPNTVIKKSSANTSRVIIIENFPAKIHQFEKNYKKEKLSQQELRRICRLLIKHNDPYTPDIVKRFEVQENEILTGIRCSHCHWFSMKRKKAHWLCPLCNSSSKTAHIEALMDYTLLMGTTITNQQARNFLQLPSLSATSKLLSSLNLPKSGNT
ncbi:nuclease-related domain-containing protein [Bacillus sp. V5-8f]|uniref:nuclease-related domain-containing protein n=1 Tax=Bacillus sp. V5-8f TaxID=2053044 RepID=UPI000C781E5D|nr:nuclease-related domain-containing protein [Bacillus sp. V5-8f]PLT32154.1 NERD nuclease [Bacillus sp. V5-8f]